MDFELEVINRCLILNLTRELDHHQAKAIQEKSDKLINNNNIKHIIFDFSNTVFMDSSGIGLIMGRYKKVIFNGGKVCVTNICQEVDRIFVISGLYKIIEKYENVDDALASLR